VCGTERGSHEYEYSDSRNFVSVRFWPESVVIRLSSAPTAVLPSPHNFSTRAARPGPRLMRSLARPALIGPSTGPTVARAAWSTTGGPKRAAVAPEPHFDLTRPPRQLRRLKRRFDQRYRTASRPGDSPRRAHHDLCATPTGVTCYPNVLILFYVLRLVI
jgi:hypothetical protein